MASDIHVALGPLGTYDYQKLRVNNLGELITALTGAINATVDLVPPNDFLITTMLVTDTVTTIPATPAANRIGVEIENLGIAVGGTGETLFWNTSAVVTTVTAVGTSFGKRLRPNESSNFELSGGKNIYAVAETGKTVLIQVTEWIRTP